MPLTTPPRLSSSIPHCQERCFFAAMRSFRAIDATRRSRTLRSIFNCGPRRPLHSTNAARPRFSWVDSLTPSTSSTKRSRSIRSILHRSTIEDTLDTGSANTSSPSPTSPTRSPQSRIGSINKPIEDWRCALSVASTRPSETLSNRSRDSHRASRRIPLPMEGSCLELELVEDWASTNKRSATSITFCRHFQSTCCR